MATPRTVQRQLEAAEAQLAAQQAAPGVQALDDPSQLGQMTQAPAPAAPEPPAPPAAAPASTDTTDYWKQKFQTVQGMYNKDVPELRGQLKSAESQLVTLTQQVQTLMAAQQTRTPESRKPEVDPRDAAAFGQDMVEMVQRYAQQTYSDMRGEFAQHIGQLEARVKAVEEAVNGVSRKTESTLETQFYATLRQIVPDFETINAGQDWLVWLAQVDPVYRVPRQAALDAAFSRMDVEGVAAIFQAFKASRPASPSAALASQVSPGNTGGGSAPEVTQARPILTQKFVNTFFSDQAKGRYRGREAEMARIENEINLAAQEGRII